MENLDINRANENASYALTYTGDDLTQVDMVVDGTTYTRTLTWVGGKLTAISTWAIQ